MAVPTWAIAAGYDSIFIRMQIFPAILSGAALYLLFWAAATLVYGRIYCSTACPLGTLMDCIATTDRLLRHRKSDYRYAPPSQRTRLSFILIAILLLLFSASALIPTLLDPYSAYARVVGELFIRPLGLNTPAATFTVATLAVAAATALGVIVVSRRYGRLICNTVCPVGSILGLGVKKAYFHIEIDPERCINCGECERVCKAACIRPAEKLVDTSRCVVCFDCAAACPSGAISYKAGRFRLGMPLMQGMENAGGSAPSAISADNCICPDCKNKDT